MTGAHAAARHGSSNTWASPLYTFIPTTAACTGGVLSVTSALSHEMAEAATDPSPQAASGWKQIADGEIGDFCTTVADSQLVFGSAQQYWSNSANACVTGFADATAPAITSTSVCGTGERMRFVLNGNFGPVPWDLASNAFRGQTLYVRASITGSKSWKAGNVMGSPPDPVAFNQIEWSPGAGPGGTDQIRVSGFGAGYGSPGQIVKPGDMVTITIENPSNGVRATTAFTAPDVSEIVSFATAPDVIAGTTTNVSGIAIDANRCEVENTPVVVTATAGAVTSPAATGRGGWFSTEYKVPEVAGVVTLTAAAPTAASTTSRVHPRLDSLVQQRGAAAGGQVTILNGLGFDSSTSVTFGNNTGTLQSVSADHKKAFIVTPRSTLASVTGRVPISVTVESVDAYGLQYDYIQPDVPYIEFLGTPRGDSAKHTCNSGLIRVSLFDAAGGPENGINVAFGRIRRVSRW